MVLQYLPYTAKCNKFNLWGKTVQITAGNDDIKKRKAESGEAVAAKTCLSHRPRVNCMT